MNNNQTITNYCNFLTFIIYFMIALIPIQMVLFALFPHPSTIVGWFSLFRDSPVVGFIGFDIFYIFSNILMIFFYISLLIVLKDKITNQLIFALILSFISITIYFLSRSAIFSNGWGFSPDFLSSNSSGGKIRSAGTKVWQPPALLSINFIIIIGAKPESYKPFRPLPRGGALSGLPKRKIAASWAVRQVPP